MSLNWKLRLPPGLFGFLMPLRPQEKKELTILMGVIYPNDQGELDYCLTMEIRKVCLKYKRFLRASEHYHS